MTVNFKKSNGLVPAIIQDVNTNNVLMLGYMNQDALKKTITSKLVTFYSRSKQRLWTKGEISGNHLQLVSIKADCDKDTLLIKVNPEGPTCHKGSDTCWNEVNTQNFGFLSKLEDIINKRRLNSTNSDSYVASLFSKGINKAAQKVGEEAIELVIEAKDNNTNLFLNECADLLFHYLILLQFKNINLQNVVKILQNRHNNLTY